MSALLFSGLLAGLATACVPQDGAPFTRGADRSDDAPAFARYRNTRFGFAVRYPADFRVTKRPANDDGVVLTGPEGARLRVYGAHAVRDRPMTARIRRARDRFAEVTQVTGRQDQAVLHGVAPDGTRRVVRIIRVRARVLTLVLDHPADTLAPAAVERIVASFGPVSGDPPTGRVVEVALLDYPAVGERYARTSDGARHGCDRVVRVRRNVRGGAGSPLAAALRELFAIEDFSVAGWQNFIARTNDTLRLEGVEMQGRTAVVHLTGRLSGLAGVCDRPRTGIQIRQTALAVPAVEAVVIRVDGERRGLRPGGAGPGR
ncbi:hypothetical protein SAOR_16030 [Salinisphaera orenii MK-B5]|uniref:GerMN domain-containing protein n=1 Tax=Salinisphaera orenii MK-B5 TaxID=856730 RepID=A0A423PFD3_9GAMM|nr:hypothetical protein SAOR_16030 [Salinisphaera orenii MK-B5]